MKNIVLNKTCPLALFFLFVMCMTKMNSQSSIIYTDIEPDFTSIALGDTYNLDINNDGTIDFSMTSHYESYYNWLTLFSINGINACLAVTPWYTETLPLDTGREIFNPIGIETFETGALFTVGDCMGGGSGCFYDWKDKNDKYLGLRFLINGKTHYGWARLTITSHTQWVIKDYAYQAKPNIGIRAGQMVLGVEDYDFKNLKIIVSNNQLSIHNVPYRSSFILYTINGQQLLHGNLTETHNTIRVETLASGLYIIELIDNDSSSVTKKKIVIP